MEKRLSGWKRELVRAHGLIAGLFARSELRARSLGYVQGLLSGCERKNGWQLAEWLGEATPYAVQHLLDRARWDADEARDRIRSYVIDELGSEEAVLMVDETGFLKKGRHERDASRPEWHGWHAARRGLGTNLYRLGVPEKTIQAILRHANVSTTNTYYIKSAADDTRAAMAKLESLVIGSESAAQSFVSGNNVATVAADTQAVVIQ